MIPVSTTNPPTVARKRKQKLAAAVRRIISDIQEPFSLHSVVSLARKRFKFLRRHPQIKRRIAAVLTYMRQRHEITWREYMCYRTAGFSTEACRFKSIRAVRIAGKEYPSMTEAGRAHGLTKSIINYIATKTAEGKPTKYGIKVEYTGDAQKTRLDDVTLFMSLQSMQTHSRIVVQCDGCGFDKPDDLSMHSACPKCKSHRWEKIRLSPLAA